MHTLAKPLKTKHPDVHLEQHGAKTPRRSQEELSKPRIVSFEKQINMIVKMAWDLSREELKQDDVHKLYLEAEEICGTKFGIEAALAWAENFELPPEVGIRDHEKLKSYQGCLTSYVNSIHEKDRDIRLNYDRVSKYVPLTDPDYEAIQRLVKGIPIFTPNDFQPNNGIVNGKLMKLRAKYLTMPSVINRLVYELYERGKVIILPTSIARENRVTHYSALSWTTKVGKPQGRLIGDTSATESGTPLNSIEVKILFDENFGNIHHPTIVEIAQMICDVASVEGWENIVLWKMDLKGAFTLLYVLPNDVPLLSFELTGNLTVMHHTGMFGYTGMPASFDVVSRVISRNLQLLIKGKLTIYVDDLIGVCRKTDQNHDQAKAVEFCEGLLGPDAVAHDKTETGRKLDIIGWSICLDTQRVGLARKNMLKTFYGLVNLKEEEIVNLQEIQRIASWAARYSLVCRQLRPFTRALYGCIQHYTNKHVKIKLPDDAVNTINLWRCFFTYLEINPKKYERAISSFVCRPPTVFLEYDASLGGAGIILSRKIADGTEEDWKVIQQDFHYRISGQSGYQNTVEFIGIVLGVVALSCLGFRDESITIRGDNKSSLKWGLTENYKSLTCRRAALVLTTVSIKYNITISDQIHIAGETNVRCDKLSRGYSTPRELGFRDDQVITFPVLEKVNKFCDPTINTTSEYQVSMMWNELRELML